MAESPSEYKYWEMGIKKVEKVTKFGLLYDLPEQDGDEIHQREKDMQGDINNSQINE